MKTWILKNDVSRSPQVAFKNYACGCRKSKHSAEVDLMEQIKQCSLNRKVRSRVKALSRMYRLEDALIAQAEETS